MYHSKVVIICWAVIYIAAVVAALLKRRPRALRDILIGAAIVAAGIGASALLKNAAGAMLLSASLLIATYFTLIGIIKIFSKSLDRTSQ